MNPQKSPLITAGQIYLNEELNDYLIVVKNDRGEVHYAGDGFRGHFEDQAFIERFPPVDPDDVEEEELNALLQHCPCGTKAQVGYIMEQ